MRENARMRENEKNEREREIYILVDIIFNVKMF